jgi:hypothetical protein
VTELAKNQPLRDFSASFSFRFLQHDRHEPDPPGRSDHVRCSGESGIGWQKVKPARMTVRPEGANYQ